MNTLPETRPTGNPSATDTVAETSDQGSSLPARPWWIDDAAWNQIVNTPPLKGMTHCEWVTLCLRCRAPSATVLPSEALDTSPPVFTLERENLLVAYRSELVKEQPAAHRDYSAVSSEQPVGDVNTRIDQLETEIAEVLVGMNSRIESLERQRQIGGR
jgi:hypothetical protein